MVTIRRADRGRPRSLAGVRGALVKLIAPTLPSESDLTTSTALLEGVIRSEQIPLAEIEQHVQLIAPSPHTEDILKRCHPLYWALMGLIGRYSGASNEVIIESSATFLAAMVVREMVFD